MANTKKPLIGVLDLSTNETYQREMTDDEFAQYKKDQTAHATKQAEAEAKAVARQAIADRLGLTADELQVLLG